MISGRDIIVLSSVDWHELWQGQHELATRLARNGNRVVYVDNLGVRAPRLADARRVGSRLSNAIRGGLRGRGAGDNADESGAPVHVVSPLVLPPFSPQPARAVNRSLLLPRIARTVKRLGFANPIVWSYLPTDTAIDLIAMLRGPRGLLVYSCVGDFPRLSTHPERMLASEESLVRSADITFAQGSQLYARCRSWSARAHRVEVAVALESFLPEEARRPSPGPTIGYVGGVHRQIDLRLAIGIARARPAWTFLFIGPIRTRVNELAALPNVRLAGPMRHELLAREIARFDVGVVPYRIDPETATVFPTKLLEYLAMGRPVVSTELPEVLEFAAEHPVVAVSRSDPRTFVETIERALLPAEAGDVEARRRAARARDFGTQLEWMSDVIERTADRSG